MASIERFDGRRTLLVGGVLALIGLVGCALAIAVDPRRALLGYLAAYAAIASAAVGALILQMICFVANAKWPAAIRRVAESITIVFPLLAVLFLPIAFGIYYLYPWASPAGLSEHEQHLLHAKRAWLNPAGFLVRSGIYLAIFTLVSELLRRWSRRRDDAEDSAADPETVLRRERILSAALLPAVGLAITFAAFDWVMSLQPTWFSSMFGVYFFSGGFGAGIAVLVLLAWRARRRVTSVITPHHFHALGRLLFGFVVFWTYTAYFQGFLIRIADRPIEIVFYAIRARSGWTAVLVVMVAAHFAVPFLLLLSRRLKLWPPYLASVSMIVLVGHVLDLYWLVVPAHGDPVLLHVADLAALAGITGACLAWSAWRQRGLPMVAPKDPYLPDAMRYASPT